MKTPAECVIFVREKLNKECKVAFLTTFILGLMIHLPILIRDIPNHDGLASVYFDQNMITSGRWFLGTACGISSFYTLPWLIGLISIFWISVTAAILTELLEIKRIDGAMILSGLLVAFPSLASTYAYIFTADGYMFAFMLACLAVLITKKYKKGYLLGGLCLCFSLGTYQAYLSFCILLCLYEVLLVFLDKTTIKEKAVSILKYIGMGMIGGGLYFAILQVLLKVQGKVLDTYQGINGMTNIGIESLLDTIPHMFTDFGVFLVKGNILVNNIFSLAGVLLLILLLGITVFKVISTKKLWKNIWCYLIAITVLCLIPLCTNIILFISPSVGYHLLMRYQYVLFLILPLAFVLKFGGEKVWHQWIYAICGILLIGNFAISVNIGYSNLQKRYEKTYAYCLRLADRMEQTEGYYTGMPVVMMGVVGNENFPSTDITTEVTGNMIGISGDYLYYTGENYKAFFKHYLGITIEIVDQVEVGEIYNHSEIYQSLDSFPGPDSMKVVDGVLYMKTENKIK